MTLNYFIDKENMFVLSHSFSPTDVEILKASSKNIMTSFTIFDPVPKEVQDALINLEDPDGDW